MSFTANYWENRYKTGGNSGAGSYNKCFSFKTNYINSLIQKYNLRTINDFGCGDGNQIKGLEGFTQYHGYDISPTTLKNCIELYKNNPKYKFSYSYDDFSPSDISLSLDVIYHIIEEDLYLDYLRKLVTLSNKYILIYAVDRDDTLPSTKHMYYRSFTQYLIDTYNLELIDTSLYPHNDHDSGVGFYLFKKL